MTTEALAAANDCGPSQSGEAPPETREPPQKNHKGRRQMDDDFMMRLYKVKMCTRTTPHNWKLCPWAHPGETQAIRRDPSQHMAELCPAVRQHQQCPHGEGCLYSRNTFESYLHPFRYRTTMCSQGEACSRNICFFAHCPAELRQPPDASQWQQELPQQPRALAGATASAQQQLLPPLAAGSGFRLSAAVSAIPGTAVSQGPAAAAAAAAAGAGVGVRASYSLDSHSDPLLCSQRMAAAWPACGLVGQGTSMPPVTAAYQPAQQLQLQLLIQQQVQQQVQPLAVHSSAIAAPVCSVPSSGAILQQELLLPASLALQPQFQQQQVQQQQQRRPVLNMYGPAAAAAAPKLSSTSTHPAAAGGASWSGPTAAGPHGMQQQLRANSLLAGDSLSWQQQQQQQSLAQTELLLQQLQLAEAASRQASAALSTDSLQSVARQGSGGSSSIVPHLSALTLPGLSTDMLPAGMQTGLAVQQQGIQGSSGPLPGQHNMAAPAGASGGVLQEMGLLPDALGLMHLSSLDEGTLVADVAHAQQQQQHGSNMPAMQQQFW